MHSYETSFSGSAALQAGAIAALQGKEVAPESYYTLEDKIVDLAIDVIAGTAHPERAKVLLREIIKEAKA